MSTTMLVEYDCGWSCTIPLVLRDDQMLLANASLGDQMILWADAAHDFEHPQCGVK